MEKLVFGDGERIGVFDGEKVAYYESEFITRYREYSEKKKSNDEWKYAGEGARFRGDYERYQNRKNEKIFACINGVQWDGEKVLYSFTVNGSSGVYRKELSAENVRENHVISLNGEFIDSLHRAGNQLAVTVGGNDVTSDVGILGLENSELKTLTSGDSRDANPHFSEQNPNKLLFDSAGVGRTSNGEFSGKYAPASICAIDLSTMEITELVGDRKYSFVKPRQAADGTVYCIRRPNKEKHGGNIFLDILLFPYRILQAIVMFVQTFVVMFTGKSLTSGGNNPAKGRDIDSKKLIIDGNLIEAEKEMKRNKKKKDKEYGFIPLSWQLVKLNGKTPETIKSGICDYDLCKDGGIYCTNGRRIFYVKESECKKIADTEKCLTLATESRVAGTDDLFSL